MKVKIERQVLPITKMLHMEDGQFLDVPLELTYYMSDEKHKKFFRPMEAAAALTELKMKWDNMKARAQQPVGNNGATG